MAIDDKKIPNGTSEVTRRNFLSLVGWGSLLTATGMFLVGMVRSMIPSVLYEPPAKFKAGTPEDYPE